MEKFAIILIILSIIDLTFEIACFMGAIISEEESRYVSRSRKTVLEILIIIFMTLYLIK